MINIRMELKKDGSLILWSPDSGLPLTKWQVKELRKLLCKDLRRTQEIYEKGK